MGRLEQGGSEAFSRPGAGPLGVCHLPRPTRTPAPRRKASEGLRGSGVVEVVARHDGDTFRAVYMVRFETAIYVLHAFQKKAKRGIATPKQELDLVRRRLAAAERHYRDTHRGD